MLYQTLAALEISANHKISEAKDNMHENPLLKPTNALKFQILKVLIRCYEVVINKDLGQYVGQMKLSYYT